MKASRCPICRSAIMLMTPAEARATRNRLGWTLREAATWMLRDATYLSKIENGRMPMTLYMSNLYLKLRDRLAP